MNEFMKIAKDLADENLKTKIGGPFGACVVKDGEVIGKGSNDVIEKNDPTAHAEIMAIKDACRNINSCDLTGYELYTTCYPCPMCLSAIIWSNIKHVYYGNTKEDAEDIGFRDNDIYKYIESLKTGEGDGNVLKLEAMDRDETIKSFNEYKDMKDKVVY